MRCQHSVPDAACPSCSEAVRRRRADCYCAVAGTATGPELPAGFCGTCQVCSAPGHTRPFPGTVPYTGAWCDLHFEELARRRPLRWPALVIWALMLAPVLALLLRACRPE